MRNYTPNPDGPSYADHWSSTETYHAGDTVLHEGKLYCCKYENIDRDPAKEDGPWYSGVESQEKRP